MYPNTEIDNKKILDGHIQALSDILKSKNIALSEASSHLRAIMLSTDSAKEYAKIILMQRNQKLHCVYLSLELSVFCYLLD